MNRSTFLWLRGRVVLLLALRYPRRWISLLRAAGAVAHFERHVTTGAMWSGSTDESGVGSTSYGLFVHCGTVVACKLRLLKG